MNRIIKNYFILLLFSTITITYSLPIDTIIIGNGSPGPYTLGWHFVDSSSISVVFTDTICGNIPAYIYIEKVNGLFFSEPIDTGVSLSVHYKTEFYGLKKNYSLYEKRMINPHDSSFQNNLYTPSKRPSFVQDNMNITGFKSISVSFGNMGQLNLEQALEITIAGNINKNTTLTANLSDQGTSLQGDTREIGELDRMFIAMENPRFSVIAGDQYVEIPTGRLIQGHKKLKGLSAGYRGKQFNTTVYGAISGGKNTVQTITGHLGFQGPYYLTGNGEADIITPIEKTIQVFVDGEELKRELDYTVNLDVAAITFTEQFTIVENALIQIHYEYKSFDYQRSFLGSNMGFNSQDSSLVIDGDFWFESDNKNNPIDINLDKESIEGLSQSGDKTPLVSSGREIPPYPVNLAEQNVINRLYKKHPLNSARDGFRYIYTPYTGNASSNKGYYNVWFTEVTKNSGSYLKYSKSLKNQLDKLSINDIKNTYPVHLAQLLSDSLYRRVLDSTIDHPPGAVFLYMGEKMGNYTDLVEESAPIRTMAGEVTMIYNPRKWLSLSVNIAAEEEDENLFSDKNDNDNLASATRSSFVIGKNETSKRSLWMKGSHRYSSMRFSREVLPLFESIGLWNRSNPQSGTNSLNVWQVAAGGTLFPDLSSALSYGQFVSNDSLLTHRIGYKTSIAPWKNISIDYSGMFINHFDNKSIHRVHKDSILTRFDNSLFSCGLHYDDEWQKHHININRGKIGCGLNFLFKPLSFSESFYFAQNRKGGTSIFAPSSQGSIDTGSTFIWDQKINHSPRKGWTFSGNSSFHLNTKKQTGIPDNKKSVLLANILNSVSSVKTGFSTTQKYKLSSEKTSIFIGVYVPVDSGKGDFIYNETTHIYEPKKGGNFLYFGERELFDTLGTGYNRKSTSQIDWYFRNHSKKLKRILRDLSWKGSLYIEEHIDKNKSHSLRSWVPGYNSLSGHEDSSVTYGNIFYRQDIDWRPDFTMGLHANIFIRPYLRKTNSNDDQGFELGISIDKRWKRFSIGLTGNSHSLDRNTKHQKDIVSINDRHIKLKQRFYFIPAFSIFMDEHAGKAYRDSTNGPYYRLKPGITLRLPGKGWGELSYTWSQVDIYTQIEHPMAQGFGSGISHVIDLILDINAGEHFTIGGTYRGEYNNKQANDKMMHMISLEVKAFL